MKPQSDSVISLRTALVLYAVLVILAFVTVKGTARRIDLADRRRTGSENGNPLLPRPHGVDGRNPPRSVICNRRHSF